MDKPRSKAIASKARMDNVGAASKVAQRDDHRPRTQAPDSLRGRRRRRRVPQKIPAAGNTTQGHRENVTALPSTSFETRQDCLARRFQSILKRSPAK